MSCPICAKAGELFEPDAVDAELAVQGIIVDHEAIRARWRIMVEDVMQRATLAVPADGAMRRGGRAGRHTEHLGHMLAEMQIVARSHPGATW